ncbi:MAG: DUF1761 domain-containing protein [Pseudomonadota bacterium]
MFDYSSFNLWAVIGAAAATFVIGGIWYGPLFGKAWMRGWGFTEADLQKGHPALVFGGAFALMLIAAGALAMLIGDGGAHVGLHWGLMSRIGFAVTSNGVDYLFERRSLLLFAVNGGYKFVSFAVMGLIIGYF